MKRFNWNMKGLVAKVSGSLSLSRREIALASIILFGIPLIFLLLDHVYPAKPSYGVIAVYVFVFMVAPLMILFCFGLRVPKRWLAFLLGFSLALCTYLLGTLIEPLRGRGSEMFIQEDPPRLLCFALALGIIGLSGAVFSRQKFSGVAIAMLGVILWLIYIGSGID